MTTWQSWGIFDIIHITKFSPEMDVSLLRVVMPFQGTTINGLVFPFGMILPTIYDLLVMFDLPASGLEFGYNPIVTDFGTRCDFSSGHLTIYIQSNKILGMVMNTEHRAFLLAWMSHYIACMTSSKLLSIVVA